MLQIIALIGFLLLSIQSQADLKLDLYKNVSENHLALSYNQAKTILFTRLDNTDGKVCSVYSLNECIRTDVVPSAKVMNVEHTWPQSKGANGKAKSDLHHLFISNSFVNSIRSSLPFCEVEKVNWQQNESLRGINSYNEACFEPPNSHKGHVARALFYFAIRYRLPIESHEEVVLRSWHKLYPVDEIEFKRNQMVFNFQNNLNPFIEKPELVDLISDF